MCFSATASFTAGVALSGVGIATLEQTKKKSELPLALFPLLFGIQQIIEGLVWISFSWNSSILNKLATCGFTFFSHIFWPMFVPFAVALAEDDPARKRILHGFQIIGVGIGAYITYSFWKYPVVSSILGHSILYSTEILYQTLIAGFYITIVCGSFFVARDPVLKLFGALLLIAFCIAYLFYTLAFASVWCFFAAVLSIIIYLYFKHRGQK